MFFLSLGGCHLIANEHRVLICRNYTASQTSFKSKKNWGAILSTHISFRSLNMAAHRIKLHIWDISNASGQFLLTLIIDILIYTKSIGHCLSPQRISLLCVLYLQRYWVLEIAPNRMAANFRQNVTHTMHSKMAIYYISKTTWTIALKI